MEHFNIDGLITLKYLDHVIASSIVIRSLIIKVHLVGNSNGKICTFNYTPIVVINGSRLCTIL